MNENDLSDIELRASKLISDINAGSVTLGPTLERRDGIIESKASTGEVIGFFNDAGEPDYIEWIVWPDGARLDYQDSEVLQEEDIEEHVIRHIWPWVI